jgi:hypothetical protein
MKKKIRTNSKFARFGPLIQEGIFFVFFFLILWLRVRPTLAVESQQPVFFSGWAYLSEHLAFPGGMMDWLGAWLMRGWTSDWLGALEITALIWTGTLLFRRWIEHLTGFWSVHTLHLIPAIFFLVTYTRYEAPFSLALGWTCAALLLFTFRYESPRIPWIRIPAMLAWFILCFWLTGGAALSAGIALALAQGLVRGKRWEGLSILAASAGIPLIAFLFADWSPLKQAFMHGLPVEIAAIPLYAAYGIPLFFAAAALTVWFTNLPVLLRPINRLSEFSVPLKWAVGTALIVVAAFILHAGAVSRFTRTVLAVNLEARRESWTGVLTEASRAPGWDPILSVQVNRALQATGRLLDEMFAWPQRDGEQGLIPANALCKAWPEEASRLFFDMGLIGEAQHWAHEAMTLRGPTPELLRLLGTIYMLKGDSEAADHFIANLAKTPGGRKAAADLDLCNRDPAERASRPEHRRILDAMPKKDFISVGRPSEADLVRLLERNPGNRIAYDYRIALALVEGAHRRVWGALGSGAAPREWGGRTPRHVQEAILLNAAVTPDFEVRLLQPWIDNEAGLRFRRFEESLKRAGANRSLAESALRGGFSGTYWVYTMFDRPASRPAEGPDDFQ